MQPLLDLNTEFGARAERRLREDRMGWLVTVGKTGAPAPNAIWFSWDGSTMFIYSEPNQAKLRHIEANPNVALHLDSANSGDDIVIVSGTAAIDPGAPAIQDNTVYVEKYETEMKRLNLGTPEEMSKTYSVAIRITPLRVRGA
jgi:PPOX class probable F420-dependent enzyme